MNIEIKYFSKNKKINSNELIYLLDSSQNAKLAYVDKSIIKSTTSAVICYKKGDPIGICGIKDRFLLKTIYIFVNEKYTNKGLGSKMLKKFITESINNNVPLYLLTRTEKKYLLAYNLYIKNNFEPLFILNKNILLGHKSLPILKKFNLTIYFIFIESIRTLKMKYLKR